MRRHPCVTRTVDVGDRAPAQGSHATGGTAPGPMAIDSAPPYADSLAWRTVRDRLDACKTPRVAMLDIDGTLTGNPHVADRVRAMLERGGYVVTFNTSRTEEMLMTRGAYDASRASG